VTQRPYQADRMCEGREGDTRVTQEGRTNSGRLRSIEICLSHTIFPVGEKIDFLDCKIAIFLL
jgi:hypothetical protein